MIPTRTDITITGELPGEDVKMIMDESSLAHLMSVLTELYSNRPLAVVREYSTNALDSHIEAGVTRPIEVSTPTDFMPYLKIKDYGVGMDAETIRTVYSKYGASTKRGTNAQNGMLGLGAKSALAYANQFHVTGIKNGVKTHVVVSRAEDESGVMKIIGEAKTNEPNGVEISIQCSRREIEGVVYEFFKYWKPGTVLVNGKQPNHVTGMKIGDFLLVNNSNDYVVMGNVAYPIPEPHRIFKPSGYSYNSAGVVAYVEMGEVNFTPSRESLKMTRLTEATLNRLREEFKKAAINHLEENVVNAADHTEAIRAYHKLQQTHLKSYMASMQYKGLYFPNEFRDGFNWMTNIGYGTTQKCNYVHARELFGSKSLIVYGFDKTKVHSVHRAKVNMWINDAGHQITNIYWCNELPGSPWTDGLEKVHWDDVAKFKIERAKSAGVKNDDYDIIDKRAYRLSGHKVDPSKTLVYASPTEVATEEKRNMLAKFLTCDSNVQLLLVNKNKWTAFKKDFPKAVHVDEKVKEIVADYLANISDEEKIYLGSDWQDRNFCARLDAGKIDDPQIKKAVKQLTTDGLSRKTEEKYRLMYAVARMWQIAFPDLEQSQRNLFEDYPLLHVYSYGAQRDPLEHIYLYMNTAYEQLIKH